MERLEPSTSVGARLTRRRFVLVGAAGATTAWLGGLVRLEEIAQASGLTTAPELRRSTYLSLSSPSFNASVDGGSVPLQLVAVEDLPIASSVPALRGHDGAFVVRLRGNGSSPLAQGMSTLSHPDLGTFELFVAPVDRRSQTQDYELLVDRTVRIPGLDGEGAPEPVKPGERGRVADGGGSSSRLREAPRVLRASLERSASGRRLLARIALGNHADVRSVRALLVRRGRVVGKARAQGGRRALLLRFGAGARPRRGRYDLLLTIVEHDGRVTSARRALRLS